MKTKTVALTGLLIALALILSYLESLVPLSFAVPGIKLGLPNLVIVFALYRLRPATAAAISLLRVALVALLFGSVLSLAYSAAGAVLSYCVMLLLRRTGRFGCTGVSVAGAVAHNLGQIAAAAVLLQTASLTWYLPVLCLSGTVAGVCIGLLAALLVKRIPQI
ncbi:MAG: Gx transporter family protein [Ruminococcaceae bacterium]|nr:Gx transporter family protein [Oscillospiraceae bacterium]